MEALRIIEAGRSTFFAFTVRFIRVLVNNVANSNDDSEKDKRGLLLVKQSFKTITPQCE